MGRPLTASEVSERTTLAPNTLYGWRARGIGPRSYRLGRRVVWDEDELNEWLRQQQDETGKGGAE